MLCNDIHGNLAQIKIGRNSGSSSDSSFRKNVMDHTDCKFMRGQFIKRKIARCINKNFINRINMDVFRRKIFQIHIVNPRGIFYVESHPWNGNNVFQIFSGASFDFTCLCLNFKKPAPAAESICLESRRDRKTNGFTGSALVRNYKLCGKRIQITFPTFN